MRHVHLLPRRDVTLLREWAPHQIPVHKAQEGEIGPSSCTSAPTSRPACRCCGYPLTAGEAAIVACYVWSGRSSHRRENVWLHANACQWGLAHDTEPAASWANQSPSSRDAASQRLHSARRSQARARRAKLGVSEPSAPKRLTPTERLVLELAEAGATVPETARRIGRAPSTVEGAVTRLNKRFGTRSRLEAAAAARAEGLLSSPDAPLNPAPRSREARGLADRRDAGGAGTGSGTALDAPVAHEQPVLARSSDALRNDVETLLRLAIELARRVGVDIPTNPQDSTGRPASAPGPRLVS
jgi:DNA-binding CsgD family transcriptional regulator